MSHSDLVRSVQGRSNGKGDRDRASLGEKVLDARNRGERMVDIARDLGLSIRTAYRYMDDALALRIPPTIDAFRKQQNDRLDKTTREVEHQMTAADLMFRHGYENENIAVMERALNLRAQAIALQLRIDERRARLNGLDAPVVVEGKVEVTTDPRDAELAEMIRKAKEQASG